MVLSLLVVFQKKRPLGVEILQISWQLNLGAPTTTQCQLITKRGEKFFHVLKWNGTKTPKLKNFHLRDESLLKLKFSGFSSSSIMVPSNDP